MPNQLEAIVQRMIDAGESEENIATVIKGYKPAPEPTSVGATALGNMMGVRATTDTPQAPGPVSRLAETMDSAAHPETLGDVAQLLIPSGIGMAVNAAGEYANAAKVAYNNSPRLRDIPGKMFGVLKERAFPGPAKKEADLMLGRSGGQLHTVTSPPARPSTFDPVEAMLASEKQKAAEVAAQPARAPRGRLRTTAQTPPVEPPPALPVPEPAAAQPLPEAWQQFAGDPLRQPRVEVGAERVGRANNMTKEQVRQQTGPVLGEAVGEASPILPEKALQRIIDTLKQLPKGGPEREAYVAKATSGKAQWQIENIRRTLEHLGLLVAAPVAGATIIDQLTSRARSQAGQ